VKESAFLCPSLYPLSPPVAKESLETKLVSKDSFYVHFYIIQVWSISSCNCLQL